MNADLVLDRGVVPVPQRSPTWTPTTSLLARRNVLKTLRSPAFVSFSLLQPVVWLVLFSQTFSGLSDSPQFQRLGYPSYLTFVAPAMMVLSVLFTALQSGLSVVTDLDTGMLDKLRTDPIARSSILVGRLIADAALMAAQATLVLVLAVAMGATVAGGWAGATVMTVGVVLFGVAWAALSDFVALHTADSELTMVIGLFLTLPVLFLTSAFFPLPRAAGLASGREPGKPRRLRDRGWPQRHDLRERLGRPRPYRRHPRRDPGRHARRRHRRVPPRHPLSP
jgi:hypothetical protein